MAKDLEVYFTNGEVARIAADVIKTADTTDNALLVTLKDGRETIFPFASILRIEKV